MGCDKDSKTNKANYVLFQSTHPHGVRRSVAYPSPMYSCCFNPRTHMGCDILFLMMLEYLFRFNPRTHMGCDRASLCKVLSVASFNPRTHMGCDGVNFVPFVPSSGFQSTHPHGVRRYFLLFIIHDNCFNPRTHMGCDRIKCLLRQKVLCFNPRTHMGCDYVSPHLSIRIYVSIHAPTWGATAYCSVGYPSILVSIHAPTWGATYFALFRLLHIWGFNPRTHMGCDCIFSNRLNITMQR